MDETRSFYELIGSKLLNRKDAPGSLGDEAIPEQWAPEQGVVTVDRWAKSGDRFWQSADTCEMLEPGFYKFGSMPNIGPFVLKSRIVTDGLIEIPDAASKEVYEEFVSFWTLKEKFAERGFLHKRGILLWGPAGCHARGQGILMFDGTIKPVEEIAMGEFLMGPDSKPREVLRLCRGRAEMYRITPQKGTPFVVNGDHVLSLVLSGRMGIRTPINMTVNDYLKQSKTFQTAAKLYRSEALQFSEQELPIPPYILGAWLGDGHTGKPAFSTADLVMADTWNDWGQSLGLASRVYKRKPDEKCASYYLTAGLGGGNIPHVYLTASINQRLELLAGLMDTDGYVAKGHGSYCSIKPRLANQVAYLARSLGFAAYVKKCRKGTNYNGKDIQVDAYNVNLSGDLSILPVQLERRLAVKRAQIKSVLRTGFTVEPVGVDEFYGFTLDRDHLYLMDDFTVTHNSGKTSDLMLMSRNIIEQGGIVCQIDHPHTAAACLAMIRKIEPERKIVALMEDLDAQVDRYGEDGYLALLDGETQINGIIYIATTNYPERLDKRFVDRPSRFDTIRWIGMPTAAARRVYLRAKDPSLSNAELETWVKETEGFSVAHLRELVILVRCFERPLATAIARLENMRLKHPNSGDAPDRLPVGFGAFGSAKERDRAERGESTGMLPSGQQPWPSVLP